MVPAIQALVVSIFLSTASAQRAAVEFNQPNSFPSESVAVAKASVEQDRDLSPLGEQIQASEIQASVGGASSSPSGLRTGSANPDENSAPEPMSILLIGIALIVLAVTARRWRRTLVS